MATHSLQLLLFTFVVATVLTITIHFFGFVVNFFNRLFVLDDQTKEVREAIAHFSEDPNSVSRIRSTLHKMHEDTLLLGETLHYLEQSMEEDFLQALPHRDHPDFDTARRLFELLDIERTQESLGTRIVDVRKQALFVQRAEGAPGAVKGDGSGENGRFCAVRQECSEGLPIPCHSA